MAYCVNVTAPPVKEYADEHLDCAWASVPTPAYQTGTPDAILFDSACSLSGLGLEATE